MAVLFQLACLSASSTGPAAAQTLEWERVLLFGASNRGTFADGEGTVYICGDSFNTFGQMSSGDRDAYLASYSSEGSLNWIRAYGGGGGDFVYDEARHLSGDATGLYISGSTDGILAGTSAGSIDAVLVKYSKQGVRYGASSSAHQASTALIPLRPTARDTSK